MKVATKFLTGRALDWAVAQCDGYQPVYTTPAYQDSPLFLKRGHVRPLSDLRYSSDWTVGGPIIEREHIALRPTLTHTGYRMSGASDAVEALIVLPNGATTFNPAAVVCDYGPTPLIAAMRCYVASKFGEEIEIPEVLLK